MKYFKVMTISLWLLLIVSIVANLTLGPIMRDNPNNTMALSFWVLSCVSFLFSFILLVIVSPNYSNAYLSFLPKNHAINMYRNEIREEK
jgi:hypothetical protein